MSVITLIEQARASFWNSRESVIASHKTWDKEKDVRITVFSKCIHMTGSTWLGLVYIHRHLIHGEWWNEMHDAGGKLLPASDAQIYVNEFDNFVKIGFIQLLISAIESSFRPVVRALDPSACANGTAEFKSIYAFLFARLKLQKWETLLDLLRNARTECVKRLRQLGREFRVELNGLSRRSALLSGTGAVD